MSRKQSSWLRLSFNLWQAGLEAQQVNSLRLALLAPGSDSAGAETARMVSEKMSAALEVQHAVITAAMTGSPGLIPARTVAIYRRKMRPTAAPRTLQKSRPRGSAIRHAYKCTVDRMMGPTNPVPCRRRLSIMSSKLAQLRQVRTQDHRSFGKDASGPTIRISLSTGVVKLDPTAA